MNGILYVVSGYTWQNVPHHYGSKSTVHRFHLYLCEHEWFGIVNKVVRVKNTCNLVFLSVAFLYNHNYILLAIFMFIFRQFFNILKVPERNSFYFSFLKMFQFMSCTISRRAFQLYAFFL